MLLALVQTWPTKPVRIVLQCPPGGFTDAVARIIAQPLSAALGQQVLVENRPGADGAIAGNLVARAEPDGHTFFLTSNTPLMQVPLLEKNPPYEPTKRFTPATLVGRYIYVMVAMPALAAKDVGEQMAVLLPSRSSLLPAVPTAAEAGLPPLNAGTWAALRGPARLPARVPGAL